MPTIEIEVKNKIAKSPAAHIVCGNSDYKIKFLFDEEWAAYNTKTARFTYNGHPVDVIFDGDTCSVPIISGATVCEVGVYAGDLHTTTPALVECKKSILCKAGVPADPLPDVYAQLMEKLNSMDPSGGSDAYPIKYVESLDTENMVILRDLESDLYMLYGYFKPFPNSNSTLIVDKGYYMVAREDEGSHLLSISPLNFRMTCHEILVDSTAEHGYTYSNTRINLLDVQKAADPFVVKVVRDPTYNKTSIDKTNAEIAEAHKSGRAVICSFADDGMPLILQPLFIADSMAVFAGAFENIVYTIYLQGDVLRIVDTTLAKQEDVASLVKTVNGVAADEKGNVEVQALPDDAEQLSMLIEADMLTAVYDANGAILTDENGNVILRY